MTDLRGSRLTGILPEHLRSRETKALAHAVGRQVDKLLALAEGVPFYACLASAPETVLDHLAVELRTPAYREAFPLEVKRALIRDSLLAYAKMGTPSAINRTLSAIFGKSYIMEWFDYGGMPHHFQVYVDNSGPVRAGSLSEFYQVLENVKRLSSWLDEVLILEHTVSAAICIGGAFGTQMTLHIPEAPDGTRWLDTLRAGGGMALVSVLPVPERA